MNIHQCRDNLSYWILLLVSKGMWKKNSGKHAVVRNCMSVQQKSLVPTTSSKHAA